MCKLQNLPKELTEFFQNNRNPLFSLSLKPNEMNRK